MEDLKYFMKNGFLDLQRGAIFRLIEIVNDSVKIREIVGICQEVFDLRLDSVFLQIRRKSRGLEVDFTISEKLKLFEEIKRKYDEKFGELFKDSELESDLNIKLNEDDSFIEGEYSLLFALLPYPSQCSNPSQKDLLCRTLKLFLEMMKNSRFHDSYKTNFFSENDAKENDLLSWLLVLFGKYSDSEPKEMMASIIVLFYSSSDSSSESSLPKKMECVLPVLMSFFTPSSAENALLTPEQKLCNSAKTEILAELITNDHNRLLLVSLGLVASLVPLVKDLDKGSCKCIELLCGAESFAIKNTILATPDFLPTVLTLLSSLPSLPESSLTINLLYCVQPLIGALASCCGRLHADYNLADDVLLLDVNRDALQRLVSLGYPLLVLQILGLPLLEIDDGGDVLSGIQSNLTMMGAANFLAYLSAAGVGAGAAAVFRPDAAFNAALETAVAFYIGLIGAYPLLDVFFVLTHLARVGGDTVTAPCMEPTVVQRMLRTIRRGYLDEMQCGKVFATTVVELVVAFLKRLCVRACGAAAAQSAQASSNVLLPAFFCAGSDEVDQEGAATGSLRYVYDENSRPYPHGFVCNGCGEEFEASECLWFHCESEECHQADFCRACYHTGRGTIADETTVGDTGSSNNIPGAAESAAETAGGPPPTHRLSHAVAVYVPRSWRQEEDWGLHTLLEVERAARRHVKEIDNDPAYVKMCQKIRDNAALCLCHLLRCRRKEEGDASPLSHNIRTVLSYARAKADKGAKEWQRAVWDGMLEGAERMSPVRRKGRK